MNMLCALFYLHEMTNFFSQLLPAGRLESSSLKRASKENVLLENMTQLRSESSVETEGLMRELKRQKSLSHGNDDVQPSVTHHNKLDACSSNLDLKSGMDPDSCSNTSICSFCQSSKTSEVIFDFTDLLHVVVCPLPLPCKFCYFLAVFAINIIVTNLVLVKFSRLLGQCCAIKMGIW